MLKRPALFVLLLGAAAASHVPAAIAVQRDARVEALEILRTDPASVRTPSGQWTMTRDDPRLDDFVGSFGEPWRVRWNELTHTPHRVWGGRIDVSRIHATLRPHGPTDKEAILGLARAFVREHGELLGVRWEQLRPLFVGFKGGRWVVTLGQVSQGREVVGGRVDLRFTSQGDLMVFGSDVYETPSLKAIPRITSQAAGAAATQGLSNLDAYVVAGEPELVFLPILAGEPRPQGARKAAPRARVHRADLRVRPAYRVTVVTQDPPGRWLSYVDAATGEVLWRYNRVRFAAASGTVTGDIHPLLGTDTPTPVNFFATQLHGGEPVDTIVSYDFEAGDAGWTAQSPWALSDESVHGGAQAWSDSPGGNHANGVNVALTSPAIDISSLSDPVLIFWTSVQLESTWDFLYVEASPDDGSTWFTLNALTGSLGWHEERYDLGAVEGTSNLRLRFRLFSDASVTGAGCWVDDVSIARLGSALTASDGTYSLTTTGADSTLRSLLRGPYGAVHAGNYGAPATLSATPIGGVADLHWTSGNSLASERDSYYGLLRAHQHIKEIEPAFTALDYTFPVFVNIPFCNAYYAGSQVVMGSGTADCADLGTWIPVMYHEYGHAITDAVYGAAGDPPGEMHEGFSDYFASTLSGDPRAGPEILGPGTMFRTIDNKLRTPEDFSGEAHIDGTILAGALWDLRERLLPDVALADSLFHFARYGAPKSFEDYFTELLTVDDDNGNLGDGTPHLEAIRSAFGFHGIGLGPEFEHVFVEVQDGGGSGDGRLDAGETVDLALTFHNFGGAETGVYAKISTSTPGVTVLSDSIGVGNVAAGADVTAPAPFRIQLDDGVPVGTALLFDLEIHSDVGFNGDCFMLPVGYVPILLVDDDRTRNFETYFTDALDAAGKGYTRWQAGILGAPSALEMAEYRAVIWFTGNDRRNTLTPSDQAELAAYMGAGGNVFVTGEDIGEDLWKGNNTTPTEADKAFYTNWLHAKVYVESESGPPAVDGVSGDVVGDGLSFTLNGGTSANNQASVSSILPQGGAVAALSYDNGRVAALRFAGTYKLFYCAFGFEGITQEADRNLLMQRALDWLCPDEANAPATAVVSPNGGETLTGNSVHTILWTASDDIAVTGVDILFSSDNGQSFTTLATNIPNSLSWDWAVTDVSSDSCLIRVEAVDPSGNVGSDLSDEVFEITATTDVSTPTAPRRYALHPAAPNPFNPRTRLRFDLPRPTSVWLEVLRIDGRRVRRLLAGEQLPAGTFERVWDGIDDSGHSAASGVYIVDFHADHFRTTQKIQLLK